MKIKKADVILTAALVIAAGLLWIFTVNRAPAGDYVTVSSDDVIIDTLSLDKDTEKTIMYGDGEYNILVIKDGYAYVSEASCPDLKCVRMKRISRDGECIICLPNKLIIEVHSGTGQDVDVTVN